MNLHFCFFQTDEVFLEAQIQNITTSPMFMEKVSLEPSIMYNVAELNTVNTAGERYVQIHDILTLKLFVLWFHEIQALELVSCLKGLYYFAWLKNPIPVMYQVEKLL